jgi:hypothetical protein
MRDDLRALTPDELRAWLQRQRDLLTPRGRIAGDTVFVVSDGALRAERAGIGPPALNFASYAVLASQDRDFRPGQTGSERPEAPGVRGERAGTGPATPNFAS